MLQQAKKMQERMAQKQAELGPQEVVGDAAGKVSITLTLDGQMKKIAISRDIVDPDDIETLQDLIISAYSDAKKKAEAKYSDGMGEFGMPGIPGLF